MKHPESISRNPRARPRQVGVLCIALLVVFALWGFVFPRIAEEPALRNRIEQLRERGFDTGAMFYSDHPASFRRAKRSNQIGQPSIE